MEFVNYYHVLKIEPNSDLETIKKAFRKEVSTYHPDKNSSPDAPEKFNLAVEAFHILSDTYKRKEYDAMLRNRRSSDVVVIESQDRQYKEWKRESKKRSESYSNRDLADLLLLDIFLGTDILGGIFDASGSILDSASDALDGFFDLF